MVRGARFPPVVVFSHNGAYLLADGFHRFRARKLAKFERIDAEVRCGTRLDALKFSLAANHRHGLPRSNEDKRHAITIALREFPDWSDRAVAELVGVSQPTVSVHRRQLINFISCAKRLGRDGKRRRLPNPNKRELHPLPERRLNGEEQAAHEMTLEVAEKFGDLETTIKSALSRFPSKKSVGTA
jgi:DNA-binding transcriptional ArsR family regulator